MTLIDVSVMCTTLTAGCLVRYETICARMKTEEGEEERSQAYFVIKAAQRKEELQREGDELVRVQRGALCVCIVGTPHTPPSSSPRKPTSSPTGACVTTQNSCADAMTLCWHMHMHLLCARFVLFPPSSPPLPHTHTPDGEPVACTPPPLTHTFSRPNLMQDAAIRKSEREVKALVATLKSLSSSNTTYRVSHHAVCSWTWTLLCPAPVLCLLRACVLAGCVVTSWVCCGWVVRCGIAGSEHVMLGRRS